MLIYWRSNIVEIAVKIGNAAVALEPIYQSDGNDEFIIFV